MSLGIISDSEALELLTKADFFELAEMADGVRKTLHPDGVVSFVIDRNINYTNICTCKCSFCAFYVEPGKSGGYVISKEQLKEKIEETKALGGTQVLLQGGLHPELGIEFYEDMLRYMKSFGIWVHGFSPPEIHHIAKVSGVDIDVVLEKLVAAGLDSIPGGGAELLVDSERTKISPNKINSKTWLGVMERAHRVGLKTTATMMFKSNDDPKLIIEHLAKVRDQQERSNGFTAFIPWPYQPDNTELGGEYTTAVEYLRVLAVSRIYLHNIKNIQVSWVTQGPKVGQTALRFGGNDFGSQMIEENVVAATGVGFRMSTAEIVNNIEKAGFKAAQRDMHYNILRYCSE